MSSAVCVIKETTTQKPKTPLLDNNKEKKGLLPYRAKRQNNSSAAKGGTDLALENRRA